MYVPVQGLRRACSTPCGTTLPEDVVRQVESSAELACSQVANAERLLNDALTLVDRNILCSF
jgi:hypothetical protein